MGGHHSRHRRRSSLGSEDILSADSLDLIYIDDYFDDAKYLKQMAKHLAEKKRKKAAARKAKRRARVVSDSAVGSKKGGSKRSKPGGSKTSRTASSRTTRKRPSSHHSGRSASSKLHPSKRSSSKHPSKKSSSKRHPSKKPSSKIHHSKEPSSKSGTTIPSYMRGTTASSSKKTTATSRPATATPSKKTVKFIRHPPPPSSNKPSTRLSTGDIPPSSTSNTENTTRASSWHGGISRAHPTKAKSTTSGTNVSKKGGKSLHPSGVVHPIQSGQPSGIGQPSQSSTNTQRNTSSSSEESSKVDGGNIKEPSHQSKSKLTSSKPSDTDYARRQRSYVIPTAPDSYNSPPHRSQSEALHTSERTHGSPSRAATATIDKPRRSPPKKKLVVRGLKNYVKTHKRDSFAPMDPHRHFNGGRGDGGGGGGGPEIWKREFPSKSKFHPDNFIYDWAEGPKAPPRPFSAMAKCKKHGGRCNDCGLFTCDLCQACRKCETDCACPCPSRGQITGGNPYSQGEVYQEIFGGDGWNKARKVLCNLTEDDKAHPVGGNASKRKQSCDENWAKNNFYKSQIDVLNPYNVPLNEVPPPGMMPPPLFQQPMCYPPPMFPMSYMPMMMPPPMMPYYPPPLPPPCPSYDPYCGPPDYPYPPSDSFIPNY